MPDLSIEREILIDAPADVVWRTITQPDQIELWFADRVQLDLRPGGAGAFVFEDRAAGTRTTAPLVIEAVEPLRRLAFRWSYPEDETPTVDNSMLVEFLLTVEGDERTRLRVVETGIDEVSWAEEEKVRFTDSHRHGWAEHLGRLGDLLGVVS